MNKILEYFKGDELAARTWANKYALKDKQGNLLESTPDDMHKRMAKEYARIEDKYCLLPKENFNYQGLSNYGKNRADYHAVVGNDAKNPKEQFEKDIYSLFKDFKYIIPGGSIMANLGSNNPTSLSNCFVVGQPEDNIEDIFNYARDSAQLFKRRGGAGIDLSTLRPNSATVDNAANNSTGPIPFMKVYSTTTETIGQDGRRAALMISLDVRHPDILDFIKSKEDKTKITAANISVKVNEEFMKAVENDEDYLLTFPVDYNVSTLSKEYQKEFLPVYMESIPYNKLQTVLNIKKELGYVKRVKAKEIWNEIIKHAHSDAEPGILLWHNHLNYDPAAVYEQYCPVGTNPLTILAA